MTVSSRAFLGGLPNAVQQAGAALTSGATFPSTMPLSYLQTDAPGDVARMLSVDPSKTWLGVALPPLDGYSSTGSPWPVDFVALVNHNLSTGAYYRVAGKAAATAGEPLTFESVAPNAISGSGVTGVVASIDEAVDSPDGAAVSINGASSYLHVSFASPVASPTSTDALGECFVVRMKCNYDGAAVVTARLYRAGTLVATLGTCRPRAAYGYFQFFAQGLAASGVPAADVELRLFSDSAFSTVDVDLVRWVTETTAAPAIADSGWLPVPSTGADALLGATLPDTVGLEPQKILLHETASSPSCRKFGLYLRDAGNSDGFLQGGVLPAGPAFRTTHAPLLGDVFGVQDLSLKSAAWSGAQHGTAKRRRRILPVRYMLTTAEAVSLVERLDWRLGTLRCVLVALFPQESDARALLMTAWCSVDELSMLSSAGVPGWHGKQYTFRERL